MIDIFMDASSHYGQAVDSSTYFELALLKICNQIENEHKEVVVEEFSFDQKRILLAEDNDINAEICLSVLNAKGAFVERVENGQVAVETFKKHAEHYYDLILMDIQMPHMDGYTATQTIRQLSNKDKTTIPIIALTANAFEEDRKKAVAQGMNGHISKPIDVDKIEKVLLSILK